MKVVVGAVVPVEAAGVRSPAERQASETVGSASWAKGSTAVAHADWSSFACGFISRSAQSERHACLRIAGDASTHRCWITLS